MLGWSSASGPAWQSRSTSDASGRRSSAAALWHGQHAVRASLRAGGIYHRDASRCRRLAAGTRPEVRARVSPNRDTAAKAPNREESRQSREEMRTGCRTGTGESPNWAEIGPSSKFERTSGPDDKTFCCMMMMMMIFYSYHVRWRPPGALCGPAPAQRQQPTLRRAARGRRLGGAAAACTRQRSWRAHARAACARARRVSSAHARAAAA
jgi:hypothetical protein